MNNFINTHEEWLEHFRHDIYKIWIRASLSNGKEYYLPEHSDWMRLKPICEENKLNVEKVGIQYKTHFVEVDTTNTDGVYIVQSILATFGSQARQTITIGKVYGNNVKKDIWITPELLKEFEEESNIESCFEQAIIYNYDKKEQARTI
jgi:hypothetical protein